MIPGEYELQIHAPPEPFVPADIIAIASIVAGQFGKGGGKEVQSALVLEEAINRFGEAEGREVWSDLRSRLEPETDTTVIADSFPYGEPPADQSQVALPDPGTTVAEPLSAPGARKTKPAGKPMFKADWGNFASNALLVSADESAGDGPVAVMGPQVGYFSPQILTELDIHAPSTVEEGLGVDARGVAFAGISMYVLLGRGTDYAWSATSANQDIEDTYAMELCDPANPGDPGEMSDTGYRFDGTCEPFEVLDKELEWDGGGETLRALRTKMGIVTHRAMIDDVPHVYTRLRATYMHEADSAVGFARFNQPSTMESVAEYEDAANTIDYTFNWFFANSEDIAYFNSGANPVRQPDVDPNLPAFGTPDNAWVNHDPDDNTFDRAPAAEHPQVTNQSYISSWNNRQAPAYSGSDDSWSYTSVHRAEALNDRIEAGIRRRRDHDPRGAGRRHGRSRHCRHPRRLRPARRPEGAEERRQQREQIEERQEGAQDPEGLDRVRSAPDRPRSRGWHLRRHEGGPLHGRLVATPRGGCDGQDPRRRSLRVGADDDAGAGQPARGIRVRLRRWLVRLRREGSAQRPRRGRSPTRTRASTARMERRRTAATRSPTR